MPRFIGALVPSQENEHVTFWTCSDSVISFLFFIRLWQCGIHFVLVFPFIPWRVESIVFYYFINLKLNKLKYVFLASNNVHAVFEILRSYALSSWLWYPLRFPYKNYVRFVFTSNFLCEISCLAYVVCICLRVVVSNTYCVVFLFYLSVLCALSFLFLWVVCFYGPFGILWGLFSLISYVWLQIKNNVLKDL